MNLWILHADTPYRMFREGRSFSDPALHIDRTALLPYDAPVVCFAFWADKRLTDEEAWHAMLLMRRDAAEKLSGAPCQTVFSLEDARILSGDPLARLSHPALAGIRILTPFWSGINRFGGAYDTETGLTADGQRLLSEVTRRGMLLDVSHASRASLRVIIDLSRAAGLPPVATHSNFFAVTPHPRNLTDEEARALAAAGGVIGLSLVPAHTGGAPDVSALLAHIDHGISLGLRDALAVGGDFDGTDHLACGLTSAHDLLSTLLPAVQERYGADFAHRFFCGNARNRLGAYLLHPHQK